MGEDAPVASALHSLHLRAWALLKNGMGGVDWAGLPVVMAHLGLTDPAALIESLATIKNYQPPKGD